MALPPVQTPLGMDEKTTCMLTWVASIFFPIIAPLVVLLVCPNNPWPKRQAAMCLVTHILGSVVIVILAITVVGLLLAPLVGLVVLVLCILGAVKSSNNEDFNPPVIGDLTRSLFKV